VLKTLQQQATLCTQILDVFRTGTLLLDEVDLVLHPLKSELNWPMGAKDPLDFTTATQSRHRNSRKSSSNSNNSSNSSNSSKKEEAGLRWQVPFHLLDAVFFASAGLEDSGGHSGAHSGAHSGGHSGGHGGGQRRNQHKQRSLIESREAQALISTIRQEVAKGAQAKLLQKSPHLVLASKQW